MYNDNNNNNNNNNTPRVVRVRGTTIFASNLLSTNALQWIYTTRAECKYEQIPIYNSIWTLPRIRVCTNTRVITSTTCPMVIFDSAIGYGQYNNILNNMMCARVPVSRYRVQLASTIDPLGLNFRNFPTACYNDSTAGCTRRYVICVEAV